jgi:hypothetical protein
VIATAQVEISDHGITIRDAARELGDFVWGEGAWTLRVIDPRLSSEALEQLAFAVDRFGGTFLAGRPRITSLDPAGRDKDLHTLGLLPDPRADVVLLVDPSRPGDLSLHFGPLHLHRVTITASTASRLISEAFGRGFEVRRSVVTHGDPAAPKSLLTEIGTQQARETREIELFRPSWG